MLFWEMVKNAEGSESRLYINALSHHQQREYRGRGHIENMFAPAEIKKSKR
jgi:hypothetical protein